MNGGGISGIGRGGKNCRKRQSLPGRQGRNPLILLGFQSGTARASLPSDYCIHRGRTDVAPVHQLLGCADRKRITDALDAAKVGWLVHYPLPPHLQQAYASLGMKRGELPIAERLADSVLSLPIGPHMSEQQVDRVIEVVRAA